MKNLFFLIIGSYAIIISFLYFQPGKEDDGINKVHETKIDSLYWLLQKERITTDSFKVELSISENKLLLQKKNISYVKDKYQKAINNIIFLSPDASISVLAGNISQEANRIK